MSYADFVKETGYQSITPYWDRFSIAERFSEEEVMTVFNDVYSTAKNDYRYLTELAMILDYKASQNAEIPLRERYCELYSNLVERVENYALSKLVGNELAYFQTHV